jgi:hypothetical protein
VTSYPTCEALLKNGEPCRSVVVDAESEDEHLRRYCGPHGDRARQTAEQADDEDISPQEDDEPPTLSNQGEADSEPEPVPAGYRGTPRDTIREFALANPHLVDEFLRGVLAATQEVWVSCKHCKRRSEIAVPNWSARTKAVELLLEQGFGKAEPAPLEPDEQLHAQYALYLEKLSEARLEMTQPLDDRQRMLVNEYPRTVQDVFFFAYADEVEELAQKHGYQLSDEDLQRLRALAPRLLPTRSS